MSLDNRYHYQRSYLMSRLAVTLGGRAAGKLAFGEYSTGAQNGLRQVMELPGRERLDAIFHGQEPVRPECIATQLGVGAATER